jgi:hypothetical protein
MNDILPGLLEMLTKGSIDVSASFGYQISFILGCGILAFVAIICDLTFRHTTGGDSLIGLNWNAWDRWFYLITYPVGAMAVGFFSHILHVFETSLMSCLVIGFSWHLVTKRIWGIARSLAEERES